MHVYIYVYAYSHACRKRFVPLPATCRPPLSLLPPLCQLLFTLCALYIFFRAFFFLASLHVFLYFILFLSLLRLLYQLFFSLLAPYIFFLLLFLLSFFSFFLHFLHFQCFFILFPLNLSWCFLCQILLTLSPSYILFRSSFYIALGFHFLVLLMAECFRLFIFQLSISIQFQGSSLHDLFAPSGALIAMQYHACMHD